MIYFTVSNLSYIHHYLRFCELTKEEVMPFTLSNDVINFFKRHKIKTISHKDININRVLKVGDLNKLVFYLDSLIENNDQFIFIGRLMDNQILYISKKIAKSKIVINYEDYYVTKSYKELKFFEHSVKDILVLIKNFIVFGIWFKFFWSHDQKSLGINLSKLISWKVRINKQYPHNKDYIFDHRAKWKFKYKNKLNLLKSQNNKNLIIFALGNSVSEKSGFYDVSLRKKIILFLINEFGNRIKIKYSPKAKKFEFAHSHLIDNKLMLEEICDKNVILISDYSTSLITCANIGLATISILGMAEVQDKRLFNFWKHWLTKHNSIYPLFPKSLEELKIYIRNRFEKN